MPTLSPGATLGEVAEIIHAAVVLGPAAWGREPMPEAHMAADIEDRLKSQLINLFHILHERNIPYLLVGGVAMLTYIEGRNTDDVDLVLSVDSLQRIPEIAINHRSPDFAHGKFGDLVVDLLLTSNPFFSQIAQKHATTHHFLEMNLRCATIEGMILLKLFALPALYRMGAGAAVGLYENDIYTLCELARPNMNPIFEELEPFVTINQLEELKSIASEIYQRIARVDRVRNASA